MAVILPFSAAIVSASRIGFSNAPESISPILRITSLVGPVAWGASWAIVLSLTRYGSWRVIPPRLKKIIQTELREEKTMASIGRRGFGKGAPLGALAFTVGGVETIMA